MRRSLAYTYFGFNLACALIALYAGHRVAAYAASEQRGYADFGDSLNYIQVSGPAMMLGLLSSAMWAGWTLTDASRRASYRPMKWLGAVTVVWVVALLGVRFT